MGRQRPTSVTNAIRTQVAVIVVSGLTALLTVFRRDELVLAWAEGNPTARGVVEEGGLSALYESEIALPAFAPVAIVFFVTFALLAAVLLVFFRAGHPSARWSLTALAVFLLLSMVALYRQDPPALFLVLAAISAVLNLLLLRLLWHSDTSAYLRGAELAEQREG